MRGAQQDRGEREAQPLPAGELTDGSSLGHAAEAEAVHGLTPRGLGVPGPRLFSHFERLGVGLGNRGVVRALAEGGTERFEPLERVDGIVLGVVEHARDRGVVRVGELLREQRD